MPGKPKDPLKNILEGLYTARDIEEIMDRLNNYENTIYQVRLKVTKKPIWVRRDQLDKDDKELMLMRKHCDKRCYRRNPFLKELNKAGLPPVSAKRIGRGKREGRVLTIEPMLEELPFPRPSRIPAITETTVPNQKTEKVPETNINCEQ